MENSLAVPWLGLHTSTVAGMGSIPGQGTKIPQAVTCSHKIDKSHTIHSSKKNKEWSINPASSWSGDEMGFLTKNSAARKKVTSPWERD